MKSIDLVTDQIVKLPPMLSTTRRNYSIEIVDDLMFVFGGWNIENAPDETVERYKLGRDAPDPNLSLNVNSFSIFNLGLISNRIFG